MYTFLYGPCQPTLAQKNPVMITGIGGPTRWQDCFLCPSENKAREIVHALGSEQALSIADQYVDCAISTLRVNALNTQCPTILLTQNLSPGGNLSDVTSWKSKICKVAHSVERVNAHEVSHECWLPPSTNAMIMCYYRRSYLCIWLLRYLENPPSTGSVFICYYILSLPQNVPVCAWGMQ